MAFLGNLRSPSQMKKARAMRKYYDDHTLADVVRKFGVGAHVADRMVREAGGSIRPSSRGRGGPPMEVIELPKERIMRITLAKRLGVAPDTISDWARRGYIPFHKIGGFTVFYEDEVADFDRRIVRSYAHYKTSDNRPKCQACGIIFEEIGEEDTVVCSECGRLYKRSKDGWIAK